MKTMKAIKVLAVVFGLGALAGVASGQSTTNFTVNVNEAIPEGNPVGLDLTTDLTVAGGNISSVTVGLDITGGFNGDLYAYLVGPNGGFAVLLNRVGVASGNTFGYSNTGFDVTLSDSAATSIHSYQTVSYSLNGSGQLTDTWQPDGENISPESAASDFPTTQTAMLSSLDNTDPNGTWTLFIADLSSGSQATLGSYTLNITTAPVPEPSALALFGLGLAVVARFGRKLKAKSEG